MVAIEFEVAMGDEEGAVTLCLPLAALEPALESFSGGQPSGPVSVDNRSSVAGALLDVPVDVKVQFNAVNLSSAEILDLVVGDVIPLRHPVDLAVDGRRRRGPLPVSHAGRRGRRLACVIVDPDQENAPWPS